MESHHPRHLPGPRSKRSRVRPPECNRSGRKSRPNFCPARHAPFLSGARLAVALPGALQAVQNRNADQDDFSNPDELFFWRNPPTDPKSFPVAVDGRSRSSTNHATRCTNMTKNGSSANPPRSLRPFSDLRGFTGFSGCHRPASRPASVPRFAPRHFRLGLPDTPMMHEST